MSPMLENSCRASEAQLVHRANSVYANSAPIQFQSVNTKTQTGNQRREVSPTTKEMEDTQTQADQRNPPTTISFKQGSFSVHEHFFLAVVLIVSPHAATTNAQLFLIPA